MKTKNEGVCSIVLICKRIELLDITSKVLTKIDYKVDLKHFDYPPDALEFIEKHATTIDFVITQYEMPSIDGLTMVEYARSKGVEAFVVTKNPLKVRMFRKLWGMLDIPVTDIVTDTQVFRLSDLIGAH